MAVSGPIFRPFVALVAWASTCASDASSTSEPGGNAFVWDETHGMRQLYAVLVDQYGLGAALAGWRLNYVTGVSADGRTIVGGGFNPSGQQEGWRLVLPSLCVPDFNRDSALNSQDFFDYIIAFFAGDTAADFNRDKQLNSQDFFDFLAAFFAGC